MAKARAKKTDAPAAIDEAPPAAPPPPPRPKPTGFRLIRMKVENFMRIIIAEITPNGESLDVWGENEQGKSSLLNAIWTALGGKDVEPEMPVRKGAKEATIELELGEINTPQLIVRYRRTPDEKESDGTIRKGKRYLDLYRPDGAKFDAPQGQLDTLFGDGKMFNPLKFMDLEPAKQAAVIAGIAGIDIVAFTQKRKGLYDARTEANRKAKEAAASLKTQEALLSQALTKAGLKEPPTERVEIDKVMDDLKKAQVFNRQIAEHHSELKHLIDGHAIVEKAAVDAATDVDAVKRHAEKIIAEAVEKMNRAAFREGESKKHIDGVKAKVAELKEAPTAGYENIIAQAEPINNAHRIAKSLEESKAHAEAMTKAAEAADARITDADKAHQAAIAAAKLPIEGLSFDENGVSLKGIPLSQEAASVRLRVSAEISAAENNKCRIMVIEDCSLLDKNMRKVLTDVAEKMNVQLICEYVSEQQEGGIHVVEGRIAP